jgi:Leucine-rich repeat (LRR) protein
MLTSLPDLPSSLKILECDKNTITLLPDLPKSLEYLDCETNRLSHLPAIPDSLEVLYCGDNQLTAIPPLPNSLLELSCGSNLLTILPPLPSRLIEFSCGDNRLTHLPIFPPTLQPHFLECFLQNPWNTHFELSMEHEDWIAGIQDYHVAIRDTKRRGKQVFLLYHIQTLSDDILHVVSSFLSGREGTMRHQIQALKAYVAERPHA